MLPSMLLDAVCSGIHPGDAISLGDDPQLVQAARDTVDAVNTVNWWSPTNGLSVSNNSVVRHLLTVLTTCHHCPFVVRQVHGVATGKPGV